MACKIIERSNKKNKWNIIFVHGAYHGVWCWEEHYIPYFEKRNYNIYTIDFNSLDFKKPINKYMDVLNAIVTKIDGDIYVIAHSLGVSIVTRYIKEYLPKLKGLIFIAPVPVNKKLLRAFRLNWSYRIHNRSYIFFSNRIEEETSKKYINLLKKEKKNMELMMIGRNISYELMQNYEILTLGSLNDKCVKVSSIIDIGKILNTKIIIYAECCHDIMLDPQWEKSAQDIHNFILELNE